MWGIVLKLHNISGWRRVQQKQWKRDNDRTFMLKVQKNIKVKNPKKIIKVKKQKKLPNQTVEN